MDLSGWNTVNVTCMREMFVGALSFNIDIIHGWDFNNLLTLKRRF